MKAQNLKRESTAGKDGCESKRVRRFSKSYSARNRPSVDTLRKKGAAVLSEAMPEGVSRPTSPLGFTSCMARSTNSA